VIERSIPARPATPPVALVDLLVERGLGPRIAGRLERLADDLTAEGRAVRRHPVDADDRPERIRDLLRADLADGLTGAILIGAVPAPAANKNAIARNEGMPEEAAPDDYWWAHPCDLYYMDLHGTWADEDRDGVLDRWGGDRRADIWVSRLRADTLTAALGAPEAALIERYLDKNHAYRHGRLPLPPRRAHVSWFTIDVLRSQREADGWGCRPELVYGDDVVEVGGYGRGELARQGYLAAMSDPAGYELVVVNCRTFPTYHQYGPWEDADSRIDWPRVRDLEPKRVLWYHLITSAPGLHTSEPYLAGIYLFGRTPTLVALSGTQHGGVIGTPTIYPDLAAGRTFGQAWLAGARYEADHWGQDCVFFASFSKAPDRRERIGWGAQLPAAVLHGDGTLTLPPHRPLAP
jgi:hypothetical protein